MRYSLLHLSREKNWFTFSTTCENTSCESIYNGKPSTKFSVTQTIEGEGTLNVIGAADLNAVLEDTELTIKDTPAEGYELTALTANETDILAKIVRCRKRRYTVRPLLLFYLRLCHHAFFEAYRPAACRLVGAEQACAPIPTPLHSGLRSKYKLLFPFGV